MTATGPQVSNGNEFQPFVEAGRTANRNGLPGLPSWTWGTNRSTVCTSTARPNEYGSSTSRSASNRFEPMSNFSMARSPGSPPMRLRWLHELARSATAPYVPASVRRQIVARLRSGEPVAAVALDTAVYQATLFRRKRQAFIDAGGVEGVPSVEADKLAAARKRIAALEAELALTRDACELFDEQAVVPPKRRRAVAEGLIARGYSARSACRITGLARSLLQYHRRRPVPDHEIRRLIVADTTS
jgi:transposase-like protein